MAELSRDDVLPCDVLVAPGTIIRAGCNVSTLLLCLGNRGGREIAKLGPRGEVRAPQAVSMPDETAAFLANVEAELRRARAKFPGDRIMTIALAEEFGELAKAVLDEPSAQVYKEAIQTAVMAARVVIDGDSSVNEWRAAKGLDCLTDASRSAAQ